MMIEYRRASVTSTSSLGPQLLQSIPEFEVDKDLLSQLCVLGTEAREEVLVKKSSVTKCARAPDIKSLLYDRIWRSANTSTDTYMEFRRRFLGIVHARQS